MSTLTLHAWHWLVLGLVLIGLESLGAGGFLLGAALSGIITALITSSVPSLDWTTQIIFFSGMALSFTAAYCLFFKKFNQKSEQMHLNDRAAQLRGRVITLAYDLPHGVGQVNIGDTLWKARCNVAVKAGDVVIIIGNESMTLLIRPVE